MSKTSFSRSDPRAIIIGCGVAGISLASKLKLELGYENFIIYEREEGIGGTWYLNTYPGVGCDVDSHLYSFSFNLNPDWSKRFAEQEEILQYLNNTVDKYKIRPHVVNKVEVVAASWQDDRNLWRVDLHDLTNGRKFTQEAEILVSCVGTISIPADCTIPGHESFKGQIWHSARWNHNYALAGKSVAVVGNGCSAAQLMPHLVKDSEQVYQFQRSAQWINDGQIESSHHSRNSASVTYLAITDSIAFCFGNQLMPCTTYINPTPKLPSLRERMQLRKPAII